MLILVQLYMQRDSSNQYLLPGPSTDNCGGEVLGNVSHGSSHLRKNVFRTNHKQVVHRHSQAMAGSYLAGYFLVFTTGDMTALSGSSTMGDSVPS